jgi:hypothetical protein
MLLLSSTAFGHWNDRRGRPERHEYRSVRGGSAHCSDWLFGMALRALMARVKMAAVNRV